MAKHLRELILVPLCFAAAFWLWNANAPVKSQGFAYVQNASSSGVSSAAQSLLVSAQPSYFFGASCTGSSTSTAGFCVAIDAAAVPADGAVVPKLCVPVYAGSTGFPVGTITAGAGSLPIPFQTGIVVFFTTAVNCSTKTTTGGFNVTVSANFN